jgi:hypothetical protein
MSTEFLLQYKRVEENYDGVIFANGVLEVAFKQYSFATMMTVLHHALAANPDATVKLQRAESANFMPIFMEQNMVDLLRADPAKYIEAHSIPHRVIDLRKRDRTSKLAEKHVVPRPVIRAGHDTLAAAFGDIVYLSCRNHRVENPITGRWCSVGELEATHGIKVLETIQQDNGGWVTMALEQLLDLSSGTNGYYLPREWNAHGPWISKDELVQKYNQYKEERSQCLEATATQKTH